MVDVMKHSPQECTAGIERCQVFVAFASLVAGQERRLPSNLLIIFLFHGCVS